MSDLVSKEEFKAFHGGIGGDTADDTLLEFILDAVEDLLESQTGQKFLLAGAVTDEPQNGNGLSHIRVDRLPVTVTTAIKVGQVVGSPDSTILAADIIVDPDRQELIYEGRRRFPRGRRNIFITYTAGDNLPRAAKLAVEERTAFIYRRRGGEHVTGQSIPELGNVQMLGAQGDRLPAWRAARALLDRVPFA